MKFGIISARYLFDKEITWKVYGEKLKKVVNARFHTDLDNYKPVIEIEVETIEQLKKVAQSVGHDLVFPKEDDRDIWIKDDYME